LAFSYFRYVKQNVNLLNIFDVDKYQQFHVELPRWWTISFTESMAYLNIEITFFTDNNNIDLYYLFTPVLLWRFWKY